MGHRLAMIASLIAAALAGEAGALDEHTKDRIRGDVIPGMLGHPFSVRREPDSRDALPAEPRPIMLDLPDRALPRMIPRVNARGATQDLGTMLELIAGSIGYRVVFVCSADSALDVRSPPPGAIRLTQLMQWLGAKVGRVIPVYHESRLIMVMREEGRHGYQC